MNFASLADLSQNILEPDFLEVRLLRPDLIVDAETFDVMKADKAL